MSALTHDQTTLNPADRQALDSLPCEQSLYRPNRPVRFNLIKK